LTEKYIADSGHMAETLAVLGELIDSVMAGRAVADAWHLRARKGVGCLQKLIQSEALSREEFFSHPQYSAISVKLMKEVWFAKESSELRLAGNLHSYL
jgi:hypothetical protein